MKIHVKAKRARIELIPLLDMIFLILVCFVYSFLSMSANKGVDVKLPVSSQSVKLKDEYIVVSVTSDNLLYVDKRLSISKRALVRQLQGRVAKNPNIKVFINADKNVLYQDLINVIDKVKESGIQKVSLQTVTSNE